MKIRRFTFTLGEVVPNPKLQFANQRPEVSIAVDIEEGDDFEEVKKKIMRDVRETLTTATFGTLQEMVDAQRLDAAQKALAGAEKKLGVTPVRPPVTTGRVAGIETAPPPPLPGKLVGVSPAGNVLHDAIVSTMTEDDWAELQSEEAVDI